MILAALTDYYERLKANGSSIPRSGYSQEKIGFAIEISEDGEVVAVLDIRDTTAKKPIGRLLNVPQPAKRTVAIDPNFLWDKTSYVLGVSASSKRTAQEHEAFKALHAKVLGDSEDVGLKALLKFLERWTPDRFANDPLFAPHREALLDANVVFRLQNEKEFLHDKPAASVVWKHQCEGSSDSRPSMCLVTGEHSPAARLHPAIKGVMGAQSSGASIVSFNLDSFTSYGRQQGENAPVSESAAFAYATALNHLLRRENRQQLLLGDATVVFWAQGNQEEEAESLMRLFFDPKDEDARAARKLGDVLEQIRLGLPLKNLELGLDDDTRIFVLGLSPNASRLSVRFWEMQSLSIFAARLARHYEDLRLEPPPWRSPPAAWRLLLATAPVQNGKSKSEDVPPQLAGEVMRAILSGGPYPYNLLGTILMRMRADGDISGTRVALCKAVLTRAARMRHQGIHQGELPVSLDPHNKDPGYLLGRLFSTLEGVQRAALGDQINSTLCDRYYGAASATPAGVFPALLRNARHHLSRLRKDKRGLSIMLEKQIGEIVDLVGTAFPKSLRLEAQGRFAIGYYHQTQFRFARDKNPNDAVDDSQGEEA